MRPDAQSQFAHAALVVLRRWPIVFGFALVFFLLALVYGATRNNVYESTAVVIVTPAPFHHSSAPVDATADSDQLFSFAELLPPTLPTEILRELALSHALLAQVVDAAQLENTTTEQLVKRVSVDLELLRRAGATTASPSLLFRVKAGKPETAAHILQTWMRLFKDRVDAMHTFKLDETYALVQDMRKVAEENLITAENAVEAFQKEWNLPLLNKRRETKQASLTALESALLRLEVDITKKQAAANSLQQELEQQPERITLAHKEPAASRNSDAADTNGENNDAALQDEILNPVRTHIEQKFADESQRLNAFRARRDETLARIEALEEEIGTLQTTIAEQTVIESRLQREAQSYKQVFDLSSVSRGKAELTRVIRASDVFIATNAPVPRGPIPTNKAPLMLAATLLGAAIGVGYVLFSAFRPGAAYVDV